MNIIVLNVTSLFLNIFWCLRKLILSQEMACPCLSSKGVWVHWFLCSPAIMLFRIK